MERSRVLRLSSRLLIAPCALAALVPGLEALGPAAQAENQSLPRGATLWSDPATWGGELPGEGSSPTIGPERVVVLDVSPPRLETLTIQGTLLWKDETGLVLEARSIRVEGGHLRVGSEERPFLSPAATIRLAPPDCGAPEKTGIFVEDGGTLELFGKPRSHSWVELARTAAGNQRVLALSGKVDWPAGGQVAIASSELDVEHVELATIASVSGATVTLTSDLARPHFAGDTPLPFMLPERAEVALLTRNIVVEGTPATCRKGNREDSHGGQIILRKTAPDAAEPAAQLSWVEFRQLGNEGRVGEYPLHFHRLGDLSASFLRACSIHHCFNRSLVVHDSQNLVATDNVAFASKGPMFYTQESEGPVPGELTGCGWEREADAMAPAAPVGDVPPSLLGRPVRTRFRRRRRRSRRAQRAPLRIQNELP